MIDRLIDRLLCLMSSCVCKDADGRYCHRHDRFTSGWPMYRED